MWMILLLCLMASGKAMFQGKFSRRNIKTANDAVFFNGLIFLFSSLLYVRDAFGCSGTVILYGAAFGIFSMAFQLFYIEAMAWGNVSLSMMIANAAIVFPITASILFFHEQLTAIRIIGIALTAAALFLSMDRTQKSSNLRKWLLFSLAAFLANGVLMVIQKFFSHSTYSAEARAFVAWSYIFSTVVSALQVLLSRSMGHRLSFSIRPSVFFHAAVPGLLLAAFQVLQTKALATLDSSLYYPAVTGGSLIMTTLLGLIFLKDKLRAKQIWSILIGVVAIVLMNL